MFSWYKCLIVSLVFSHLGFWSGSLFLIAPFPDLCLLVLFSMAIVFPLFCFSVLNFQFLNNFSPIRVYPFRPIAAINLSSDITGVITMCHNDRLRLKLVY